MVKFTKNDMSIYFNARNISKIENESYVEYHFCTKDIMYIHHFKDNILDSDFIEIDGKEYLIKNIDVDVINNYARYRVRI